MFENISNNKMSPLLFVIFGATGDLAQKKILPSLIDLYSKDLLPQSFKIIGFSRKDLSHENYREFALNAIKNHGQKHSRKEVSEFLSNVYYEQGDIGEIETYRKLDVFLNAIDKANGICSNRIFYLALTPNLYEKTFTNLSLSGLVKNCSNFLSDNSHKNIQSQDSNYTNGNWTRILVEKPFGSNKEEAKKLDKVLGQLFEEKQIFRIDHYLAKESIQNILTFRFANAIFEPLWNKDYIENIKISLYETGDVEKRSGFYDEIGALRDVGQNHLLQMAAVILMSDPHGTKSELIRKARYDILSKIYFDKNQQNFLSGYNKTNEINSKKTLKNFVRAQYLGYQKHDRVRSRSTTETFFSFVVNIKDPRWLGVPIILESGKALSEDLVEIVVTFKEKPSFVCPIGEECAYNNQLAIKIQPEQKIELKFWVRKPGLDFDLEQKILSFDFANSSNQKNSKSSEDFSSAYEKILYDCIRGDLTLFPSTEEVATEWRIISEILESFDSIPLVQYEKGSTPDEIKNLNK